MTTPKCVLGVFSSGALGGAETTGGLGGFLLEVVLFSANKEGGGEGSKVRHKTTRANRSPELSVPQGARGTAPDVGYRILSFLLLSGNVEVLSGRVSSFHAMASSTAGECVFKGGSIQNTHILPHQSHSR